MTRFGAGSGNDDDATEPHNRVWRSPLRRTTVSDAARAHSAEVAITALTAELADVRRILKSLGEGVIAVDGTGLIVHANPAAVELLSMDPKRARGHHMFAAIPSEETCSALELVLRGGEGRAAPVEREIELPQPSGVTLRVQIRVVPLRKQ
ncbi:MAG: PAS domain-containing protein, partial [Thermoleophilia bacterium]|nr:PAS domain-containing protein [Thermoleophilia bacterium]